MLVGLLRGELRIVGARSLKEKRRPLRSLLDRLRQRFHCAAAEVEYQNLHQRAAIGISVISADRVHTQTMLNSIREYIERNPDCQVIQLQEAIVAGPGPFGAFDDFTNATGNQEE